MPSGTQPKIDPKQIKEHAKVTGSDGQPVGTVDHLDGDRIKLTKNDPQAAGVHHFLPISSVASVDAGGAVKLSMSAADAKKAWQSA